LITTEHPRGDFLSDHVTRSSIAPRTCALFVLRTAHYSCSPTANVEGILTLALHAKHDAAAIDLTRRQGYDFVPAYEMPMDVAAWAVPVWRDVAKAKRWMLCCLFGGGRPVADLAINGIDIIVEV
jgi:hypothetical protein